MPEYEDECEKYQCFQQLTTSELEHILLSEISASDGQMELDCDMAIVKILRSRQSAEADYKPADVEKAWNEFREWYQNESQ